MAESLEEEYKYENIFVIVKWMYSLVQAEHHWFKEYFKTMTLKVLIKNVIWILVFYIY